ncbi:MAG: M23 family metallopeptidase [Pseudomonadales bacterium]|nr:M23 family metallopeptidase [Pseudomonadales bacterium]
MKATLTDIPSIFGIRSLMQVKNDVSHMLKQTGDGFQFGTSTLGFFRPDISVPTYLGRYPKNRLAPIFHCFDREGGGKHYSQRVTRNTIADFRGKSLGYDEHDGVDFACPVGTELTAAASGHVVMIRDNWLRGGLTIAVDHGHGLITQYTHCWKPLVQLGQEVLRGEAIALSGSAGVDMTISFPWVSPHIHFMVWHRGLPVDPFLANREKDHTGTWCERNRPGHQEHPIEPCPDYSEVDEDFINEVVAACTSSKIRSELEKLNGNAYYLAAYLEDALHHDRYAWKQEYDATQMRLKQEGMTKLWMPLTSKHYDGAILADKWLALSGWI